MKKDGLSIKYIKNPSKEVQLAAVQDNGISIKYIKNQSKEVQLAAVNDIGISIEYIKNPSIVVQSAAVKNNYNIIKYIKNPSIEVQLAAVQENAYSIEYIKNPSIVVQLAAVKNDYNIIKYIKNPSIEVRLAAVKAEVLENGHYNLKLKNLYYKKSNKFINIEVIKNNVVITNLTNKFIEISSIIGYEEREVLNYGESKLPPKTELIKALKISEIEINKNQFDSYISFGFALEYKFSTDEKVLEFYDLGKYKIKDLL